MQTTMTFDWGVIMTAVAPTLTIIVSAVIGGIALRRARKADAKVAADHAASILKQGHETHVLVNDQLTREKATRLLDLRTNRAVLGKLLGHKLSRDDQALLATLDAQIKGLAAEVRQRDVAAGTLLEEPDPAKKKRSSDSLPGGKRSHDPERET